MDPRWQLKGSLPQAAAGVFDNAVLAMLDDTVPLGVDSLPIGID